MNTINASSLFHFTQNLESVKGILHNGFRLSYCMEKYSEDIVIGLPMICFCDIPLMRTYRHRLRYGDYMIGVSKDRLREKLLLELNPILYRNSIYLNNVVNEAIKQFEVYSAESQKIVDSISLEILSKIYNREKYSVYGNKELESQFMNNGHKVKFYETLLAYSKLYKDGEETFYDESEWRVVGNNWGDTKWIWSKSNDNWEQLRKEANNRLWSAKDIYYSVSCVNDITHIIVKEEKEVHIIAKYILESDTIMGIKATQEDKILLLTKITSLERINNDY